MVRRVTTAPAALRAFRQARLWLCQPGAGAAGLGRWRALRNVPTLLRDHPYLGVADKAGGPFRQLVVSNYRVIYRISPDTGDETTAGNIRILMVFGPGRE